MNKGLKISIGALTAVAAGIVATENVFLAKIISDAKKDYADEYCKRTPFNL